MKTVIVVYTENPELSKAEIVNLKKYAFNSESELHVGDYIKSPNYKTPMLVVRVGDAAVKYYNKQTGDLSNKYTSTNQEEVKTLEIRDNNPEVVYGSVIGSSNPISKILDELRTLRL